MPKDQLTDAAVHRIQTLHQHRPVNPVEQADILATKAELLARIADQRAEEYGPCDYTTQAREIADEARAIAANATRLARLHRSGGAKSEEELAAVLANQVGPSQRRTPGPVLVDTASDRGLDPLALRRSDVELLVRWLEEVRRFKPSTISRRLSVVTCFYRTWVIDAVLDSSPAAYVRRPSQPAESPTPGLSHLQFEAMIVAARTSTSRSTTPCSACSGCACSRPATPASTTSAKSTATASCG